MITMNHHPTHTNNWYAENESPMGKPLVVGNLVYSLVLGMSVPDVSGSAIANLEVESLKHAKPTFHGDTIYAVTKTVLAEHHPELNPLVVAPLVARALGTVPLVLAELAWRREGW
jgi:acyl dehydratase